jgi:hypothetical protein
MCDATTLISIGAQVAGAAVQNDARNQAERGQAALMRQNRAQNRQLEDSQRAAIQSATAPIESTTGKQGMDDAASALANVLRSAISGNTGRVGAVNRTAPKIVQDAAAAANAQAVAKAQAQANAVAKLDGLNQYLQTTVAPKIADASATGQLTGNFMRGNSNVLDTGLRAEGSKAYSPLAQILSGAGQVGLAYGLSDMDKADKVVKVAGD